MIRFTESSKTPFHASTVDTSPIDTALDPNGELPDITIDAYNDQQWQSPPLRRIDWRVVPSNEEQWPPYGKCSVILDGNRGVAHFDGIEIDEEHRNKKIGTALYLAAINFTHNEGYPFTTQTAGQSEDAVRIWKKLNTLGIAEEITPFQESPRLVNNRKKFYGEYIIRPTPKS